MLLTPSAEESEVNDENLSKSVFLCMFSSAFYCLIIEHMDFIVDFYMGPSSRIKESGCY
jgi:hypothetical protein